MEKKFNLELTELKRAELLRICDVVIKLTGLSDKQLCINALLLADEIRNAKEVETPIIEEELTK